MLLSTKMITGFNTDVPYDGRVYHVQTEDRGQDNPVLESLVYIGGTIIAKKSTPYGDQLSEGASEVMIASLLKRQHQVIIAAIKAGRIDDLIKYSSREQASERSQDVRLPAERAAEKGPAEPPAPEAGPTQDSSPVSPFVPDPGAKTPASTPSIKPAVPANTWQPEADRAAFKSGGLTGETSAEGRPTGTPTGARKKSSGPLSSKRTSAPLSAPSRVSGALKRERDSGSLGKSNSIPRPSPKGKSGGLDLDEVISDYLKRAAEQGKLDLKVLSPGVFTAGKTVALRVEVSFGASLEADAIVTIKIIGTAFKPQVFIGRAGRDGVASFNLALPAFTAGTAAIVIEAQSNRGRGELKHLIRRS
ncbi:MAG TPA: hypothetical protein VNH22_19335 [Blastocatellia bacterium]|jgi:hypothetical protein|nr:hypothetical protein [Blastocatellia bacterium]